MSQVFDSLGKKPQGGTAPQNPAQALAQIKADPAGYIRQMGYNVPDGIDPRNPQTIIDAMMRSGQVPASRYQQAMRMMQGRR